MFCRMRKHPANPFAFPMTMLAELTMSSWETIFHRSMMMAQGTCTAAEYHRMTAEKVSAMQQSMLALATGRGQAAVFHASSRFEQ